MVYLYKFIYIYCRVLLGFIYIIAEKTKKYYDDGLYNATQFIKNAIYSFSKLYPSVLTNDSGFFKNVPKHWGVSKKHEADITKFIDNYYIMQNSTIDLVKFKFTLIYSFY